MANRFSVKTKVLLALLTLTVITAATVGLIAVGLGISTLKQESFNKLVAIREMKAVQVENWFRSIDHQIRDFSAGIDVENALKILNESGVSQASDIHAREVHQNLKKHAVSSGLKNLYLAGAESGKPLYSVYPVGAPGVYPTEGSDSNSLLELAVSHAAAADSAGLTFLSDFSSPGSVADVPVAYLSAPVYISGEKAGVLVYEIPISRIDSIMTGNLKWLEMGFGLTGEAFLVGSDRKMRSQSRFLFEDSAGFFKTATSTGMPPEVVRQMRKSLTAIGLQEVRSVDAEAAFRGETGTAMVEDYRGISVLSAYKLLNINNLQWIIISKTDRSEVMSAIRLLFKKFLLYISLLFVFVITFSMIFARDLSRPVESLAEANEQLKAQSAAMKSAANGIIITDIHGIVKWVNPAFTRLTGYDFADVVGHNLKMLNSGMQDAGFFKNMWAKILAGEVWQDEVVNKRKDGRLYTEEMTITPVRDSQGKISQFVAIKQDITERKRLEQIVINSHERMEGELNVAKDIQMSMLPLKFPAFPEREDIDVFAKLIPAREVGGDFYDFYFIDEENFCFVVGDVSGKGVPAALFMAVTKALLKAGAGNERSTARILTHVNNQISKDNENSMFITVFMAILNTTTGYLVYSNAGHNPSFVLRKGDGKIQKLSEMHGVVVGIMEGIEYKETVLQLNRGDSVFAYTDGVTEAQDKQGRLYSDGRLADFLDAHHFTGCRELVDSVVTDVIAYENGADHADDITALSVHFREQTAESVVDFLFTTITNKLENIATVIGSFETFAAKHNIQQEIIQKINIVFDELLTNTISYAYQDLLEHEIEVKIRFYEKKLIITIMDDGLPYNPFDRSAPDTLLALDDREIGGLGVHLVKLLVDDYSYEYKNQVKKNITSFKKHI